MGEIAMTDQAEEMAVDEQPVEAPEDAGQVEAEDVESEEIESEGEEQESEFEEVDYEGKRYSVPKELKDALMMRSDYTRKSQEVAENRKQFEEAQRAFQQHSEIQQRNLQAYAQVASLDAQLQQYQQVDWNKFSEDDPVQAQQSWFQYQQLKEARQGIAQQITQSEQQALQEQQQRAARLVEQGKEVLQREIKGWSPELAQELTKAGQDNYGFSESELKSVLDPRMVKVLHDAYRYHQIMNKATKTEKPPVQPVKSVRGKSPGTKNPDKMTTEEWLAWRNKQIRG